MNMGEIKFKQKGRDDQAEPDDMTYPNKAAELMGVNPDELMKSFCKPKIKVGTEWVTKGMTCEQVILTPFLRLAKSYIHDAIN